MLSIVLPCYNERDNIAALMEIDRAANMFNHNDVFHRVSFTQMAQSDISVVF